MGVYYDNIQSAGHLRSLIAKMARIFPIGEQWIRRFSDPWALVSLLRTITPDDGLPAPVSSANARGWIQLEDSTALATGG